MYPADKWPEGFQDLAIEAVKRSNDDVNTSVTVVPASPQSHKTRISRNKKTSTAATPNQESSGVHHRLLELSTGDSQDSNTKAGVEKKEKKLIEWICAECLQSKNSVVHKQWEKHRLIQACSSSSSSSNSGSNYSDGSQGSNTVEAHQREVSVAVEAAMGHELLHRRVLVWWHDDSCCYGGLVEAYDPFSRRHRVLYDDGEWEFIDLANEPVLFVVQ